MRLLPHPDRPYAALKDDLVRAGWVWANEMQVLPLLPGEPEWVEYRHPEGGKLRYEFNPAVGLREIEVDGPPQVLSALASLPQLSPADVATLLDGPDVEKLIRGLFAARALRLMPLLPRIHALTDHADDLVRRAATDVARTLPVTAAKEALERFQELKRAHPDRSALLAMMPVAADRRQVLRWMGRDRRQADGPVEAALRAGLADEDAEVRATAALVAARLGALALADGVRTVELPPALAAARSAALDALTAGLRLQLPPPDDDGSLLLHALVEPLPVVPPPSRLPRHLTAEGASYRLARSGIEVALVPALPHWLGSTRTPEDPLRSVTGRPFAIAVTPLDARAARALGEPVPAEGTLLFTLEEATEFARALGRHEGVAMSMPTDEQWEMAIRGPDGRRHPAGNLDPGAAVSPWGLAAVPGPEWLEGGLIRDAGDLTSRRRADPAEGHPARVAMAFPL